MQGGRRSDNQSCCVVFQIKLNLHCIIILKINKIRVTLELKHVMINMCMFTVPKGGIGEYCNSERMCQPANSVCIDGRCECAAGFRLQENACGEYCS